MTLAVTVDAVAKPGEELGEVAPDECLVQASQISAGLSKELSRVKVAQRVGREIAEEPGAPVDVLEAALGVVTGANPQGLAILLVPGRGQIMDRQVAGEHRLFQVEADDDVQVVSHLVGLNPDQAGLDVVDGGQELVERDVMEGLRKDALVSGNQ